MARLRLEELIAELIALLLLCALCPHSSAQVAGGTISGTVTDPSGAVVPKARVEVLDRNTGIARTLVTNDRGFYSAPNLEPGPYNLTFSAAGFETSKATATVTVGAQLQINMSMTIGATTQIDVKGDAPQIELASSTTSATVGGQTVRQLPLNGRDWTSLATLEPNVHSMDTQVAATAGNNARANRGWGTQLTIGGNRPQQNVYRLDGVIINDYSGGGPGDMLGLALGVDAVQEFSVITGNASADYGRTSGGVINAVTRAGTNDFHGSLYEFIRNSALDARNFFDGASVPPFKRNQFGAAIGGPVIKNHTFFFFDYEGLRQSLSATNIDTVPSINARNGILTTGKVTVSPLVIPFLAIYPLPDPGQTGDIQKATLISKQVTDEGLYTTRIDQTFSEKDAIHGTFLSDDAAQSQPDAYNFTLIHENVNRKDAALEESHIFTPSVANFARLGFARTVSLAPAGTSAINPLSSSTALGFVPGQTIGEIQITGITPFAGGVNAEGTYQNHYNSYQAYDDLFWTHGAHSLKIGGSFERIQANAIGTTTVGFFTFGSLKNFLQDVPASFTSAIPGTAVPIYMRQSVPGAYIQDDWHVRPNLTLNLGLRYEMATVPTEAYGHLSVLQTIAATQPHLGSPYFNNPTYHDYSPRVGFAWDPFKTGTTAIRGGFGIYDTLPLTYEFSLLAVNVEPYSLNASLTNPPKGSFPTLAYQLATAAQTLRNAYIEQNPKRSYVEQWSFNIQQQIPWSSVLQVGYSGAHGVHQPFRTNDANIVLPTDPLNTADLLWPTPAGSGARINPTAGTIDSLVWDGSNTYNALMARFSREKRGVRIGASYTWSKSLDISSSSIAGTNFSNTMSPAPFLFWPTLLRGPSDFNVGQNFVTNVLWELPGTHQGFARKIIGGWQLSGILSARTGLPFTPIIGGDPLGLGNANPFSLPDRLTGPGCTGNAVTGNPNGYIKLSCFAFPTPSTRLGDSGRNILTGPGSVNLDTSLIKEFGITERLRAQFRADAFNVLNHTNFGTPSRTAAQLFGAAGNLVSTAGLITTTATTSRQLQFALKILW